MGMVDKEGMVIQIRFGLDKHQSFARWSYGNHVVVVGWEIA
jgi:hypothetical protein